MTGVVVIGGVNAKTAHGATAARGCYKGVLGWPSLKPVDGNDWKESDGYEPDLSSPRLDSRNVELVFNLHGDASGIRDFYRFLGSAPDQEYTFNDLGRTITLRLVNMTSLHYAEAFHIIRCSLVSDTPLEGYTYQAPSSPMTARNDYTLDGSPLSSYGVRVLSGTISSVLTEPPVKPLLVVSNSVMDGSKYAANPVINDPEDELGDDYETVGDSYEGVSGNWKRRIDRGSVTYGRREITLRCLMTAPTLSAFWRNFDALLHDLSKPGARTLAVSATNSALTCHYVSQEVEDYSIDNGVFVKFSVTLAVMGSAAEVERLLSSEDCKYIITEDGKRIPVKVYQ